MKQKINDIKNIFNEYLEESKEYYKIAKEFFLDYKNIWPKIKKSIQNPENRKKYVTIVLILVVLNIFFVSQLSSFGFYYETAEFPIIHNKIGNLYLKDYDYVLLIYLQNDSKDYHLVSEIPTDIYKYSGYKCDNGSVLVFNEDTRETNVNLLSRDVCSIYFDHPNNIDLMVDIMLQETENSLNYKLINDIPVYGYVYDHFNCENNSTLEYNSNLHTITLNSNNKDKCYAYFNKVSSDIKINLLVENTTNTEDFVKRKKIPSGINYSLNTERSYCTSKTGERKDTNLSYTDGYINVDTDEITECSVYLNKNE